MSIGIGFLGLSHPHCLGRLKAANANENARVVGVFDPDMDLRKRIAELHNTKACDREETLLEDSEIALIVIESTNKQNANYAIRCAEAGKALLIEKPGANNLERMQDVLTAIESNNVFAQVGYHLRYSPAISKAKSIAKAGLLGKVTTARFHCAVMSPWLTDPWFCDADDLGGLVFNDFCHMLDLLIVFLGSPTGMISSIKKVQGLPVHRYEDSAAFIVEFGDVLAAGDVCGWEANDWITTWDIQLYGTKGTLHIGVHPPSTRLFLREPEHGFARGWNEWSDSTFDGDLNYRYEIADILRSLKDGIPTSGCSAAEALAVMSWIASSYETAGKM